MYCIYAHSFYKTRINKPFFLAIFPSHELNINSNFCLFFSQVMENPAHPRPFFLCIPFCRNPLNLMTTFDGVYPRVSPSLKKKPLSTGPECNCLKLYSVRYTYPIYFYIISCINVINKFQFEFVCGFSFVCDNCMNHLHIGCTVFDRRYKQLCGNCQK